jgi:hypothetical protein
MPQGSRSVIPGKSFCPQNACAIDEALIETHQNTVVNVRESIKSTILAFCLPRPGSIIRDCRSYDPLREVSLHPRG